MVSEVACVSVLWLDPILGGIWSPRFFLETSCPSPCLLCWCHCLQAASSDLSLASCCHGCWLTWRVRVRLFLLQGWAFRLGTSLTSSVGCA